MTLPDAPWVGLCREDYYGYDEDEEYVDDCLIEEDEDEEDDDELYG